MSGTTNVNNRPLDNLGNGPLALVGHRYLQRNYVNADQITKLAVDHYKKKKGKGMTWKYLIEKGLASSKSQAQKILKYHLGKGTLFTLGDKRPQQYYATRIKSEIIENLQKNTPIDPSGLSFQTHSCLLPKVPLITAWSL